MKLKHLIIGGTAVLGLAALPALAAVLNSNQVGTSPVNGYYLQTNGATSTWQPVSGGGSSTGTPNYVAVYGASGNLVATSDVYDTLTGNVGIGTTAPHTALDVNGDITDRNVTSSPFLATNASGTIIFESSSTAATKLGLGTNAYSSVAFLPLTGGTLSGGITGGQTFNGLALSLGANSVSTNVAVGSGALSSGSLSGGYNTANGYYSLFANTTGNYNTANGYYSLHNNTTGNYNTANGYYSLFTNTTGTQNTANGFQSLYTNTTGTDNTANGGYSLYSNTTSSNSVALGYAAGYHSTIPNAFYVGDIQQSSAANDQNYSLLYGNFAGVAATTTGQFLTVNGNLNASGNFNASGTISQAGVALGSNAFSSVAFLPLTGGTISGALTTNGISNTGNVTSTNGTFTSGLKLPFVTSSILATDANGNVVATTTSGGSSSVTSTYVAFGSSANTVTGNNNFTFTSSTQQLNLSAPTSSIIIGAPSDFATETIYVASSVTFSYTGSNSSWTIPTGIKNLSAILLGASGGPGNGYASSTVAVPGKALGTFTSASSTGGTVCYYSIGGTGQGGTSGGSGGGGFQDGSGGGGTSGGGGGGTWLNCGSNNSSTSQLAAGGSSGEATNAPTSGAGGGAGHNVGGAGASGAGNSNIGSGYVAIGMLATSTATGTVWGNGSIVFNYQIPSTATVFSTSSDALYVGGHILLGNQNAATSSVTSCGVNAGISGVDTGGTVYVGFGGGSVSSCTINFGTPFQNLPILNLTPWSPLTGLTIMSETTSSVTVGFTTTLTGGEFNYITLDQSE